MIEMPHQVKIKLTYSCLKRTKHLYFQVQTFAKTRRCVFPAWQGHMYGSCITGMLLLPNEVGSTASKGPTNRTHVVAEFFRGLLQGQFT